MLGEEKVIVNKMRVLDVEYREMMDRYKGIKSELDRNTTLWNQLDEQLMKINKGE